jgi:Tol biopolymer transport system component
MFRKFQKRLPEKFRTGIAPMDEPLFPALLRHRCDTCQLLHLRGGFKPIPIRAERRSQTRSQCCARPGFGFSPAISADGRYVVFVGLATLLPGSSNGNDIYVRDRVLRTTERVSLVNGNSFRPSISADGRYVAFETNTGNLGTYVRDRLAGLTERIDIGLGGALPTSPGGSAPAITGDGRFVFFHSSSTNLVSGDTNSRTDIFMRDRALGATERVNIPQAGGEANDAGLFPATNFDGRFVAFTSTATNLVSGDTNNQPDIFVRDRATIPDVQLSVADVSSNEGSFLSGAKSLTFTVSLSAKSK